MKENEFYEILPRMLHVCANDPFYKLIVEEAKKKIQDGQVFDEAYKNNYVAKEAIEFSYLVAGGTSGTSALRPLGLLFNLYIAATEGLCTSVAATQEALEKINKDPEGKLSLGQAIVDRAKSLALATQSLLPLPEVELPEMVDDAPETT